LPVLKNFVFIAREKRETHEKGRKTTGFGSLFSRFQRISQVCLAFSTFGLISEKNEKN
jgi:hypothetical protein